MSTKRVATCVLCEAACGILVEVEGDKAISVRGDPDDPMSRGYVCPKVVGMKELHEDPDRLREPMIREGRSFRKATWDEALDAAARGIQRVRRENGHDALAIYQGNPTAHNFGLLTVGQVVLRSFDTKNLYSASSADQVPQMLAAEQMFGNPVLMPVPDLERTQYLLILGANPAVSNGSIMTAPNVKGQLERIRSRGGRVVVVDPRRTETADIADEHVFIRPASDPLFLLSLLHVVFEEGLARPERIIDVVDGWQELEALAKEASPQRVAAATGIAPETIRRVARDFAKAPSATAYGRVGICHQPHGTIAAWLIYALNVVTGNLDRAGGAMFTTPAVEVHKLVRMLGFVGHDRWRSRVRGLAEVAGELPVATLADEIETPGEGQIRALLTCAGNPVLSAPNGSRIDRALGTLSFMVSIDCYLNETTRHADVILPPVSVLERSHYDIALNAFSIKNGAKYVAAPLPRPRGGLHDWEILLELALQSRLDSFPGGKLARRIGVGAGRALAPEGMLEILLRAGPQRVSLRRLKKHPHGLDLGFLEPRLARVIETKNKRIQLCPRDLAKEASGLFKDTKATELALIGRRHLRSNNSWMHNTRALVKGPDRCTLLMHPEDARARALSSGAKVEVRSRVGSVVVPLEISDEVMRGVVSLPHGFGHDRPDVFSGLRSAPPDVALSVARRHAGASLNDLTDDQLLDNASGNAAFSGVSVEVRAVLSESLHEQN